MRRTYVRRRVLAATAVAVLVWIAVPVAAGALDAGAEPGLPDRRYVVQTGDTLWGIAVDNAPQEDPRMVVDAIAETNGIEAALVPGQEITLPSFD